MIDANATYFVEWAKRLSFLVKFTLNKLTSASLVLCAVKHSQSFASSRGASSTSLEELRETARRLASDSCLRQRAYKIITRQETVQSED